jgi:hypothetical protein
MLLDKAISHDNPRREMKEIARLLAERSLFISDPKNLNYYYEIVKLRKKLDILE